VALSPFLGLKKPPSGLSLWSLQAQQLIRPTAPALPSGYLDTFPHQSLDPRERLFIDYSLSIDTFLKLPSLMDDFKEVKVTDPTFVITGNDHPLAKRVDFENVREMKTKATVQNHFDLMMSPTVETKRAVTDFIKGIL